MKKTALVLLSSAALVLGACRGDEENNNNNNNNNPDGGTSTTMDTGTMKPMGDCPMGDGAAYTICELKNDGNVRQPALDQPVEIKNVVVTSPAHEISRNMMGMTTINGFFVQDTMTTDALKGAYSGILVTVSVDSGITLPTLGQELTITGQFVEFGADGYDKQKQIQAASITAGNNNPATAMVIGNASDIATGGPQAKAYEGVLVSVENVKATKTRDIAGRGGNMIFGAFEVDNSLLVTSELFSYNVGDGEDFNRITGVLRVGTRSYNGGIYSLNPRTKDDIDSKNPAQTINKITTIQDPNAAGRPEICSRDASGQTGRCPEVDLKGVIVTAAGGYVSRNLRAVWVQDPTVTDGRFAGVKVVYPRDTSDFIPAVGDMVDVKGEAINYYRGTQLQNATFTMGTGTGTVAATVVTPADVARNSDPLTSPYEGVLVRIENVSVTARCEDSNMRDFGNWVVTGDVYMGTAFQYDYNGGFGPSSSDCSMPGTDCSCAGMSRPMDLRTQGDMFQSITGVTEYSFDIFRLSPRDNNDLVR